MNLTRVLGSVWGFLISLRLAVVLIASLAVTLMVATFVESAQDTRTAQYFIYQAKWFYALLACLGLNILAVAISRYPWKTRHIPFLLAHAGILMILAGSWLTDVKGLDGTLQVSENEISSAVQLNQHILSISSVSGQDRLTREIPWIPTVFQDRFQPIIFKNLEVEVDQYRSDAVPKVQFVAPGNGDLPTSSGEAAAPAVFLRILGSPMGGAPEFWLWAGEIAWSTQKMGLARFLIRREEQTDLPDPIEGEARFELIVSKNGSLRFESKSPRGEIKRQVVQMNDADPTILNPGWKMPIQVQVKKFLPMAVNRTTFAAPMEKSSSPVPAIHLRSTSNPESGLWLGLGDRAELERPDGTKMSIGFYAKTVVLPFAIRLNQFEVKNDPGTKSAAGYLSRVQVVEELKKSEAELNQLPVHEVSMNEPLQFRQYTFYQASFIPDFPRPVTTVLSVNQDPGRVFKYWGSLLLVFGSILLFVWKTVSAKLAAKRKVV